MTSRDDRFAAAVAGGVVSDVTSMAGTSDAGHFIAAYELNALPAADRARYDEMSPLARVEQVRTPTLVLHGADDVRCPVGQAEQWHAALREHDVPSRLVLYPGASHLFILDGKPSHRLDFNRRIVDWVEQYAGDAAGPRRPASTLRTGSAGSRCWPNGTACPAPRSASCGVGTDELVEAAYGVLNKDTGVEVTADSVFQIGSVSKVWTATVVMQLVDEGLLDLDAPISRGAARAAAGRPGRHQAGDDAAPAHAHERHRRRRLHRHRSRRRLHREVRRRSWARSRRTIRSA